ncbi:MAG TPA: SpoIIE family protein phosphatase [Burkholderiales bacterium]|nr:SpoIIE family protein phosphatase [Burkholderiales bacterium]
MPKGQRSPDRQADSGLHASSRNDELSIAVDGAEVRRASEWLEAACRRRAVPQASVERLELCLHEALANVINHGGRSALPAIALSLKVGPIPDGMGASVTVSDAGAAFNPLSFPQKAPSRTLDEAAPGGLGLVMIRRCSDWLDYCHEGGRNHFTFGVCWEAKAAPGAARFRRGPDRREAAVPVAQERRRGDRRSEEIRWIPLFRDADHRELAVALADCEVQLLPAGATLLRPGEPNYNVFILLAGKLVVHLEAEAGADAAIEFDIFPGECVGELSAIDGKPSSAAVLASEDARVLRMDREAFWHRVMRLGGVAQNLMITLTERMRRANGKALSLQREQLELKHLRKELEVARQLQASMLPLQRPLFPGRSDIEVCGFMEPASKVGGDLFDVFFVDDRTLFVCVGDVSGHGIAAALFMVRVIGLLRTLAMETTHPEEILETLNDRLCIGNDANLFVTLFCGFLDVTSGSFVYANGGHCAPMVCRGRDAELIPLPKGILIGASSGRRYSSLRRDLAVGETLLCYTDGVTEAENRSGEPFSEAGCLAALRGNSDAALPDLLDALHGRVINHTGSKVLTDDCTMLAVRRIRPEH